MNDEKQAISPSLWANGKGLMADPYSDRHRGLSLRLEGDFFFVFRSGLFLRLMGEGRPSHLFPIVWYVTRPPNIVITARPFSVHP